MSVPESNLINSAEPLDEKVWQAWVEKGRRKEIRFAARRLKFTLCLSPLLVIAALIWLVRASGN
jgi:hypothetical protein